MQRLYIPKHFYKSPASVLAYEFDWGPWLTRRGDTIASIQITAVGLIVATSSFLGPIVTVSIAGGVLKAKYTVNCKITTTGSTPAGVLVNERSIVISIKEC